jgi:transposase
MEDVHVLEWPANSPDLSPIENIWAIIKERLNLRNFRSFEAYKNGLIEEWNNLDQNII